MTRRCSTLLILSAVLTVAVPRAEAQEYYPAPSPDPVDPPVPVVVIRVRVAASSAVDSELQYRMTVENTARAAAHHVTVRDPLPANVQFVRATPEPTVKDNELRWQFGTLAPMARKEIVLVVKPTGPGEVRNCAHVQFEHGQCVVTRIGNESASPPPVPLPRHEPMPKAEARPVEPAKAELRMRMSGPAQSMVELGPVIDFRTEITNVGSATAKDVVVTNKLPTGLDFSTSSVNTPGDQMGLVTWKLGDIPPGQTKRIVCTVIPKVVGSYTIKGDVRESGGGKWDASTSVSVGEPKLSIVATGPKLRLINRPASYLITVSNPGTMPVTNVVVSTEVTEGMTMVSVRPDGLKRDQERFDKQLDRNVRYQEVKWSFASLAPGEKRQIELVLKSANEGKLNHLVIARADRNLEQSAQVQTEFEKATGLTSEIEQSANTIEVGGKMTYKVRVINQGDGPAKGIGVTVFVPEQMSIDRTALGNAAVDGNKVTFPPATLAGAPGTAEFVVPVTALKAGEARLRVELTSDLLRTPVRDEASTIVVP